ncbi:DUF547 domain-containing protein [Ectothiorhodospiraceae bacterium WFHF3C12]|nr:DUF547 domain-containing protein [Ectothiorhodospiraceae bacterium WFHF3C12]
MSQSPKTRSVQRVFIRAAVIALFLLVTGPAAAAPSAELWPRWQAHDPDATRTVDHSAWGAFLARYREPGPDGIARLDYAGVSEAHRRRLQGYIEELERVAISEYDRDEQLAYWLNLYNAVTVEVVLAHPPVDSIRDIDISPGWFSDGPWGAELVEVEGEALTLNDIEHRILRPVWQDPRIHYGVNCASLGCPNLLADPFTADRVDQQLTAAARAYVNHPRGVGFNDGELIVSSIYHWFRADFGDSEAGVIRHLRRYAGDQLRSRLADRSGYDDHRYDWSLNAPGNQPDYAQ